MQQLLADLARYIGQLEQSNSKTTRAEDRRSYADYLAAAAIMFASIQSQSDSAKFAEVLDAETRSFGWDYLDGEPGQLAEAAFNRFKERALSALDTSE